MKKQNRELLVMGGLTDDELYEVAELLKDRGLRVFNAVNGVKPEVLLKARAMARGAAVVSPPSRQAMEGMMLPERLNPVVDRTRARALLALYRVRTAYDLTQVAFTDFMVFRHFQSVEFGIRIAVVAYMIEHGISFSDLHPGSIFRTPIAELEELSGMQGALGPLRWLEMLAFATEGEVSDLQYMGDKRMVRLKEVMETHGLVFDTGQ